MSAGEPASAPGGGHPMLVRFWGTRGSLPVALAAAAVRAKIHRALRAASGRSFDTDAEVDRFIDTALDFPTAQTYGGSSACVEIDTGGPEYVLCDLGSGLRAFSQRLLATRPPGASGTFNFFVSHVHWDHIMGFPFFLPAYIPGTTIRIHGCHDGLEAAFRRQHGAPSFPVDFERLGADIRFVRLAPGRPYEVAGLRVTAKLQPHGGDSYGYRFERDGKAVVYSTDAEHKLDSAEATEGVVDFLRNADLVIFDAMYSLADAISVKEDWGHSSNIVGVDLCHRARVKHYCMFHHEPVYDDEMLHRVLLETIRYEELMRQDYALRISTAYDGLEIIV